MNAVAGRFERLDLLLQFAINGLIIGTLYGMVAMCFVLVFKASRAVNFAQGEFLLVGAWLCWGFMSQLAVPFWAGFLITMVAMTLLGALIQAVVIRPLIGEPVISVIMVTIGLSVVLRGITLWIFGPEPKIFPGGTAGATYAACSGSQIFDVPGMQGFELYDVSGYDVRTFDLGFTLESGTYDITTSSFDGYPGRKDVPLAEQETSERWWAEFLDADGNVVGALPGPTTDLPDDTDVAEVVDRFDDVVLSGTATQVRFVLIRPVADPGSGDHDATTTAAGTGTAELSPQGNRGWQPPAQEWPKWGDDEHPVDDPPPVHEEKPAPKKSLNLVHVGCVGFDRHQTPTTTTSE